MPLFGAHIEVARSLESRILRASYTYRVAQHKLSNLGSFANVSMGGFKVYIDGAHFHKYLEKLDIDSYDIDYRKLACLVSSKVSDLQKLECMGVQYYNGSVILSSFIEKNLKSPRDREKFDALKRRESLFRRRWPKDDKSSLPVKLEFLALRQSKTERLAFLRRLLKYIPLDSKDRTRVEEELSRLNRAWKQDGVDGKIIADMTRDYYRDNISTVVLFAADSDFAPALKNIREDGCRVIVVTHKSQKMFTNRLTSYGANSEPLILDTEELRCCLLESK